MSLFITIVALLCLLPALYAAYGEVQSRLQSQRLTREVVRAFNRRYGAIFPEPEPVFTDAPTVLGIDGQAKMSKSAGNTIPIFAEPDEIRRLVMSMVTDPLRIKRTDPGRPEVCNVCQLHRFFGSDFVGLPRYRVVRDLVYSSMRGIALGYAIDPRDPDADPNLVVWREQFEDLLRR